MIATIEPNLEKIVTIDFLYLDLNTCDRCQETETHLDQAIHIFEPVSKCLNYKVIVNKVNVDTKELAEFYRFESSPTIRVNGMDILGAIQENLCTDCSSISGQETSCRVFKYDGKFFTEPPISMILEGIFSVIFNREVVQLCKTHEQYVLPENLEMFYSSKKKKAAKCACLNSGCC